MQQWTYRIEEVNLADEGRDPVVVRQALNTRFVGYLNELGKNGWEAVSVKHEISIVEDFGDLYEGVIHISGVFKRPMERLYR